MKLNEYIAKMGWQETKKYITFKFINQGNCRGYHTYNKSPDHLNMGLELMDHYIKLLDADNKPVAIITQPYNYTPENIIHDNKLINVNGTTAEYLPNVEARYQPKWCSVIVYRKSSEAENTFYKLKENK